MKTIKGKKIWGILSIIILGGLAYLAVSSSNPPAKPAETSVSPQGGGQTKESKKEEKKTETVKRLIYRQNSTSEKSSHPGKQMVQIKIIDLTGQNNKLLFTDLDEDFQIRLVDGLQKDSLLVFATPLNETAGSIWEIKTDGTGAKKQLIAQFNASSFTANNEKIAFVSYDNVKGVYLLWTMNLDGRFKTKIMESETALSDPVFAGQELAFIKINKEDNGSINTTEKEIFKAKDSLLYGLSFAANKFTYVKTPKAGGAENAAEIALYDTTSGKEKQITSDKEADSYPVLSKDGSKIAFYKNGKIWLGSSDGTDLKVLIEGSQPIGFAE